MVCVCVTLPVYLHCFEHFGFKLLIYKTTTQISLGLISPCVCVLYYQTTEVFTRHTPSDGLF
jgi:hypothetical protein